MSLLIDGYNLLHVTGIFGQGRGAGGLHRSRESLLRFLAASIDDKQRPRTTIVFDAAGAPPGLPRRQMHEQITVHFAANYADADEMIEQLIEQHDAPRSLLVVSSDHRIQRAARRRRARFTDSDVWYAHLLHRRAQQRRPAGPAKPSGPLSAEEIAYWLKQFEVEPTQPIEDLSKPTSGDSAPGPRSESPSSSAAKGTSPDANDLRNPFPPGYADDLVDE